MLPKEKRLIQKKDYVKIQRYGRRFSEDNLQLQVLENGENKTRVGLAVGRKFSKKAVERNAFKRKLREIFARELKNIKAGADIIISVRGASGEKQTSAQLKETIFKLLEKSKLFKKD